MQVVAGTNYEIRINVTCPSANNSDIDNTLGLEAHVFWPLPGSNEEPEVHAALACTVCCMPHWPMLHAVLSASTPAVRRRGNLLTHQPLDLPPPPPPAPPSEQAHIVVLSEPTAEDAEDLSTLDDAADAIVDDVSSTVDSAVDQATSTAGSVAGQAGSAIDAAVGTVESGVGTAVGAADSAYDAAVDGIDSAVDSAGNAIDSAASTVGGTVQVRASCVCACLPVGGWVCGAAVSGPCCCRSRICRRCRSRPGLAWPYLKRHPVCVCSMPAVGRGCCHQCDWQHLWLR